MNLRVSSFVPSTLRSRLAATVGALVVGVTLLLGPLSLGVAEGEQRALLGDQQLALVTSAAGFMDERLEARLRRMEALAAAMPPAALADVRVLQTWLSERGAAAPDDFANLVAFSGNGDLVASSSSMPSAQPISGAGRQYFDETLRRRRGIVSEPFKSRLSGAQVVLVTAPVFDAAGAIRYVLGGRIDLQHANFLRQVDALGPGRSGYLFLVSAGGTPIDHPAREQLLQEQDGERGEHPGTAAALRGVDGWVHGSDREGAAIFAYKRLRTTGWVLGARYPDDEAFAPLARMRRKVLGGALILALLAASLAWWTVRRQLRPLDALQRQVAAVREGAAGIDVLQLERSDEIGALGRAFHDLVQERERASARMRAIADSVPAVIAYVNRDERVEFTNAGFDRMLGLAPGAAVGSDLRTALGEAGYARLQPLIQAVLRGERGRVEDVHSEDRRRHQMIDYLPDLDADGLIAGFYVLAMDISERKEAELAQSASERRLRLIADNLPVLICYIDRNHRLGFANATFRAWSGLETDCLEGLHLAEALGKPAYDGARLRLRAAFEGSGSSFGMALQTGGSHRILEWTVVPELQRDGNVAGVYALAHDVTRIKEAESRLVQMARIDDLTGIANRRLFGETLARAIERARRRGEVLGLAYLDIDHFKRINDTLGHATGDEVLKEFARRLAASVRASDTVARLAGDEFVIVLEDAHGAEEAARIGAKVIDAMRAPFVTQAGDFMVTASVGITLADAALYAAKGQGRGCCVVREGEAPRRSCEGRNPSM
jgi:diguanylate cyclase (GGDEF)-like protein/PAS domain S-box-containing protein